VPAQRIAGRALPLEAWRAGRKRKITQGDARLEGGPKAASKPTAPGRGKDHTGATASGTALQTGKRRLQRWPARVPLPTQTRASRPQPQLQPPAGRGRDPARPGPGITTRSWVRGPEHKGAQAQDPAGITQRGGGAKFFANTGKPAGDPFTRLASEVNQSPRPNGSSRYRRQQAHRGQPKNATRTGPRERGKNATGDWTHLETRLQNAEL